MFPEEKPGVARGFGKIIGWMIAGLIAWTLLILLVWLATRSIKWWAEVLT